MANSGIEAHLSVYAALVSALCRTNRTKEAQNLLESMLEKQWSTDDIVWTVLVDGLIKEGLPDFCLKFLHIMESRNCSINIQTYAVLDRELSKVDKSIETDHLVKRVN